MKIEKFEAIVEEELNFCASLLIKKGKEYNEGDSDRLATFKRAAALMDCSPAEALAGMMSKHTMSIYQMITHPENHYSVEKWTEKITDNINYLLLLKALIYENQEDELNV